MTDLRFGAPDKGAFHAVALIDSSGAIIESEFTYGSGRDLGYGKIARN
jgi:hypothetical protein